jgi:hypothetical protein
VSTEPPNTTPPPAAEPQQTPGSGPPARRNDDLGLTSLVLGSISLVALIFPVSILLSPLLGVAAIVTGAIGLKGAPAGGRHRALIGLLLGVGAVVAVAGLIVVHLTFWYHNGGWPMPMRPGMYRRIR